MKKNNLQRRVRIAGLLFSMIFGFVILSATTASAQRRDDRRYDNQNNDNRNDRRNDEYYDNDRDDDDYRNDRGNRDNLGFQQAYRAGLQQGFEDARYGRRANANRAAGQAMRGINNGRNSRLGNGGNFRQAYREAFVRGYQEGYNRYENRSDRRKNRNRRNGF